MIRKKYAKIKTESDFFYLDKYTKDCGAAEIPNESKVRGDLYFFTLANL